MPATSRPLLPVFRFELTFDDAPLRGGRDVGPSLPAGFTECSGLEGTMEPKVIKEGGRNDGALQRVGPVTWATVVLKRGIAQDGQLFRWFEGVSRGGLRGSRKRVRIRVKNIDGAVVMTWLLDNAMPVKFKAADLNAKSTEVGIEELHLAHEGLQLET